MNVNFFLGYFSLLKTLCNAKTGRKKKAQEVREAQVIKLEHNIVLFTRAQTAHTFRTPWSVSVDDLSLDIRIFQDTTGHVVTQIGCEIGSRAETYDLVRKLREKLL